MRPNEGTASSGKNKQRERNRTKETSTLRLQAQLALIHDILLPFIFLQLRHADEGGDMADRTSSHYAYADTVSGNANVTTGL